MPNLIYKGFTAVETKVVTEYKGQPVEGYVETVFSVTGNKDRQADIIEPGAFKDAVESSRLPTVVYGHQWDDLNAVLGKTVEWNELAPGDSRLPAKLQAKGFGGMRAVTKFDLETPAGRVGFTHVKNGNLVEWSFAFEVAEGGSEYDQKAGVRRITKIAEVFEVSLVLIGANPATATTGFKGFTLKQLTASHSERANARLAAAAQIFKDFKAAVKAAREEKGTQLPTLTGDEAPHAQPLMDALTAIDTLIVQEQAEPGVTEYDCVIRLACIGQAIQDYASYEASGYGGGASIDPGYMAAQPPTEQKTEALPGWLLAIPLERKSTDQSLVTAHIQLEDGLEALTRMLPRA